jgi:hyperosmotically inducible protein
MKVSNLARTMFFVAALAVGAGPAAFAQAGPNDAQIQADATKALNNSRFSGVHAQVQNGLVVLSGNVALYSAKEEADKKVHHVHNVRAVENSIQVGGPNVPTVEDATLAQKLAGKLAYDRVGYGTTAFNSININVHNGVVTLSGTVYGPVDKDAAISDVENYPGVRDVVDNIEVAPVSMMDDQTRIAVFRAVYGYPALNKYAIDPAKPIRIVVVNGNVTLEGAVDSAQDKQLAGMRANQVPNVFKVTNNLQVVTDK